MKHTLEQIKAWRQSQWNKSLPSGFQDYFRLNNVCQKCRGDGVMVCHTSIGAILHPSGHGLCDACNGTGTHHA